MEAPSLLLICLNAFVAVLGLLSLLSLGMRLLITLFPERVPKTDAVVASTIQAAVASVSPGARVTRIEETRTGVRS